MASLSYDSWGAFVVAPLLVALTVPVLQRVFRGDDSLMLPIAIAGLVAKLGATLFRYWVAFDAYGGQADAGAYHDAGTRLAEQIRGGDVAVITQMTSETGTEFIERLTGVVYALFGSSLLGGFMVFAWMGYVGLLLFVRAAMIAVPGLQFRRYAMFTFFAPSLLYWSSSIGKEAPTLLCLGLASYGGARLLIGRWGVVSVTLTAAGIAGTSFIRPHFAAMWVAGLALGFVVGFLSGDTRRGVLGRTGTLGLAVLALVGLTLVAAATVEYLDPPDDESTVSAPISERVTDIFDETERRTTQGGSGFDVVTISGPQDYPIAVVRTLTRPALVEASSFAELLPALEMTTLLVLAVVSWRRIVNLPVLLPRTPYLVMAVIVLVMFGVAFTSIGNLGVLTRQRSLVMPLFLLPYCLPRWGKPEPRANEAAPTRWLSAAR
jgi:hypothetical protein